MQSQLAAPFAASVRPAARSRDISPFEFWPNWLFYPPILLQWLWLGLRHGDLSLLTAANPALTAGGLSGEAKTETLDQVSGAARDLVAPYAVINTAATIGPADLAAAEAAMGAAAISYPIVAKPNYGCNGTGVRLIEDAAALSRYLGDFPRATAVVLQTFVPWEGEAGVFYIREPGAVRGRISSITLKFPMHVTGDGRSTLRQLILADRRAAKLADEYFDRFRDRLDTVLPAGTHHRLVFVGNHCKGSIFRDATAEATPDLLARVEAILGSMPEFHFGRLDVRYESLAALRRGEGFRIIEINGVGSEATHVWDPDFSLWQAWRAEFAHYRAAWRIAAANRKRGFKSVGTRAMWRLWRRERRMMASYPLND
jgi:hypothetical protein